MLGLDTIAFLGGLIGGPILSATLKTQMNTPTMVCVDLDVIGVTQL